MLGILTVVASLPAAAENGWIAGYVSDSLAYPLFGNAISGATVTTNTGGYSATSNATGWYNMTVAEGNYTLKAVATGYLDKTTSTVKVTANNTTDVDIVMAKPTGNLTGKITDKDDGSAIYPAFVKNDALSLSAMTDSSGKYTFTNIPVGTITFNVTAIDYPDATFSATITVGQTTTKDIQLEMQTSVTFYVLYGDIIPLPYQGATVKFGNNTGTTDGLGMVTFQTKPGTYDYEISASGKKTEKKSVTITKGPNTLTVTMKSSSGGGDVGLLAGLLALGCLVLILILMIPIVLIVVIIVVIMRRKKAKAAVAQAAAAPAYPPQGVPPPPPGQAPPPMPPPGPPMQ